MPKLWITRGLPASGKTTYARELVASRPPGSVVRLNRDDLRRMALPGGYTKPQPDAEAQITNIRDAALARLLRCGRDVIIDDTNLRTRYVRDILRIAGQAGATVEFVDFTHVPVDECLRRDAARPPAEQVGAPVILDMHRRYLAPLGGKPLPVPEPTSRDVAAEPYEPPPGAPRAVLIDLDGTVALLNGRNPYDETRVSTDLPNTPVVETARALVAAGYWPVFMSGRTEGCRARTKDWLIKHLSQGYFDIELHMRAVGDTRPDHVVKLELFNQHVRDRYDVRVVLDDRSSVVALWRSIGLTCLQVAPGDF